MPETFDFNTKGDIPSKSIDNAIKKFTHCMDRASVIGFHDTILAGNGKQMVWKVECKYYSNKKKKRDV